MPAIAVTTKREHTPAETLPLLNGFQEAFYRDAVDITDNGSCPELVAGSEIDTPRFLAETAGEGAEAPYLA